MKNNPSIRLFLGLFAAISLGVGCANTKVEDHASTQTDVSLSHGNYKMIKAGAEGKSYGFRIFLGIIPITAPSTADARTDLYRNLGESLTGKSAALVNVTEDRSTTWLFLFSIPKIVITGDVVEFNQDNEPAEQAQQASRPQ